MEEREGIIWEPVVSKGIGPGGGPALDGTVFKAQVTGGYLVRYETYDGRISMCFVPNLPELPF